MAFSFRDFAFVAEVGCLRCRDDGVSIRPVLLGRIGSLESSLNTFRLDSNFIREIHLGYDE